VIDGVALIPLRRIADERGAILHMLRCDAPHFRGFGEIYFSLVNPKAVKAWHRQHVMIRHYAVPCGAAKIVLYDDRRDSPSAGEVQEVLLGEENYQLLVIPPLIWSGFTALADRPALIADCATLPHDPAQASRRDPFDPAIPYRWEHATP
jgi:dTDP-4-dehydrorhamnose 3,5-epimerase